MEIKDGGILIITAPRTGGTNLMKSIGSAYNKPTRFEYDVVNKYPKYDPLTDVLKYIPLWESDVLNNLNRLHDTNFYNTIIKNSKEFNTIILLDRLNKKEQVDSYYVLKKYHNRNVFVKWKDEKIDYNSSEYKLCSEYINLFSKLFEKLSKELNVEVDYYENVYNNKSLINKEIKLDLEYFKLKYKLRQDTQYQKLI